MACHQSFSFYNMVLLIRSIFVLAVFSTFVLLQACSGSEKDPSVEDNNKDRQAILINWVDNIVVPSYDQYKPTFDVMVAKANLFTASPSVTTLNEFRAAWVNAYIEWQSVELFEFGPADKYTLRNFFNIYPADVIGINTNINDPLISLDLPASYTRQGFPALDYLLNGVGATDEAIVSYYTSHADASKRIAYVKKIVERMNTLLTTVITEWKGSFRDTFISKTGLDIGSSMGLVVNAYVLHYERFIRSGKIGIPSAALEVPQGGTVRPEKTEAYYKKDLSKTLAVIAHQSALDFFNGKHALSDVEGPSFKSYLIALNVDMGTSLSTEINNQFDLASTKLTTLSPNFQQQLATDNNAMIETFNVMQGIVRMLKVDMTSALSITITYTDNDGD